ncbi:hypothetical protein G6F66_015085 [Rhizopus arrhizus]|nr:hypothetical protein G6F66_015085 [Rhizopus arrhizus]
MRRGSRLDEHGAHAWFAAHADAVRHPCRHPDAARGRHDPETGVGIHHHHAGDRIEQLPPAVPVPPHAMAVFVIHRQPRHGTLGRFVGKQVQIRGRARFPGRRRGWGGR